MPKKHAQLKQDLHTELQLRYKEFFESRLAIDLLKGSPSYSSVNQISAAIVQFIESNKETVIRLISEDPKIIAELREPYFGSCYDSTQEVEPAEVVERICGVLHETNLSNVMQIHCIFIQRIYDHLEQKIEKAELVSQIFPASLFNKENRPRIESKEENVKPTTQLGISRSPVFTKMLPQSEKTHLRALERYTPNYSAAFFKSAVENTVPVVCGPSGHTGSLILGAKLYGDLNEDQLKEYALLSFAFLAAGGNHSFYEVMVVVGQIGIEMEIDNYRTIIPSSIKQTDTYNTLRCSFPEFLEEKCSSQPDPVPLLFA